MLLSVITTILLRAGNAAAGALQEIFLPEITTARIQCVKCKSTAAVGALRLYADMTSRSGVRRTVEVLQQDRCELSGAVCKDAVARRPGQYGRAFPRLLPMLQAGRMKGEGLALRAKAVPRRSARSFRVHTKVLATDVVVCTVRTWRR
jgi:hypothetical protein